MWELYQDKVYYDWVIKKEDKEFIMHSKREAIELSAILNEYEIKLQEKLDG